ncbi:MAG: hypothetical protein DMG65_12120 [Candidatus Angelobacter sp. Gp1-AA117]|nr:MAG: hypothetical protein DMG65_12120 [Candidatus Angelobacter sp. Gp1-AA117]
MTNTNLTLVLSFDEAGNYEPAGHNLTPEKAAKRVTEVQSKGRRAATLEQRERHPSLNFKSCRPCREAAQECTKNHDASAAAPQEQPEITPEENSGAE